MPTRTAGSCRQKLGPQPQETNLPPTKKCSCCGKIKPRADFTKNKNKRDGLGRYCKLCHRAKDKAYRARRSPESKAARWARERAPAKRLRNRVQDYGNVKPSL